MLSKLPLSHTFMLLRIIIFSESTNKNKKNKDSNKLFHKKTKKETLQIATSLLI